MCNNFHIFCIPVKVLLSVGIGSYAMCKLINQIGQPERFAVCNMQCAICCNPGFICSNTVIQRYVMKMSFVGEFQIVLISVGSFCSNPNLVVIIGSVNI